VARTSQTFTDLGYSVMPSFLEAHEVPLLGSLVEAALTAPSSNGMSRPGNDIIPLRWDDSIVRQLLASDRRITALRTVLQAPDLRWLSAYVSSKPSRSPALVWHQDWWCWDHPVSFRREPVQAAVLCYLGDTNRENGALRVLPRSHHASMPLHRYLPEPHSEAAKTLPPEHPAVSDTDGQVTLALDAGDAVVMDYRLLHGTHSNATTQRRDAVLFSFVPGWRMLPRAVQAHLADHPALPGATELASAAGCYYSALLPVFDGVPASLCIKQTPPEYFSVACAQQLKIQAQ
jgi:hypothetical protein